MEMYTIMQQKTLEEVYSTEVYVENLVIKEVDNKQVVASATIYFMEEPQWKKKKSILLMKEGSGESFRMYPVQEYNVHRQKGSTAIKVDLLKKVNLQAEVPHYPVLFLDETNPEEGKKRIYAELGQAITTPLMKDVEQPQLMAGDLFTTAENAKAILNHIQTGELLPSHISTSMVKRAEQLLNFYHTWVEVVTEDLREGGLIHDLKSFHLPENVTACEIKVDEALIEERLSALVADKTLPITMEEEIKHVKGFDDYMPIMAPMIRDRIESMVAPLHQKGDVRSLIEKGIRTLKRKPYDAQTNAIEACVKAFEQKGRVQLIGEMGTGKTSMAYLASYYLAKQKKKAMKLLVLSPDHIVKTGWEDEIKKIHDVSECHVVKTITQLQQMEKDGLLDDEVDRVFVLSQRAARDEIKWVPGVRWNKRKQTFHCASCAEVVTFKETYVNEEGEKEIIDSPADVEFFLKRNQTNRTCKSCGDSLWQYARMGEKHSFVYLPLLKGFVPREGKRGIEKVVLRLQNQIKAMEEDNQSDDTPMKLHRLKEKKKKYDEVVELFQEGIKGLKVNKNPNSPLATFIFKKMKYRFTSLIIDELHEFQKDSLRSKACAQLAHSVKYFLGATGTGMNGYADSRFRTDFLFMPERMKEAGYSINDADQYQVAFGVMEKKWKEKKVKNNKGMEKVKRTAAQSKRMPGISPVIFPKFMQDITVFISMDDMPEGLPELEYIQEPVELDDEVKDAAADMVSSLRAMAKYDSSSASIKNAVTKMYAYLDSPGVPRQFKDKYGEVVYEAPMVEPEHDHKLQRLLELVQEEKSQGRKTIVYTRYSSDDINGYLRRALEKDGVTCTNLAPTGQHSQKADGEFVKVKNDERETFIRQEANDGADVLIVNPELVKTGCNLVEFSTVIYYQLSHQVYTNRQADRRTYRINQDKNCKVIYLFYKNTVQQAIAEMMASKIVASTAIEGNMDAQGLQSMVVSQTAEQEMAQCFHEGIAASEEEEIEKEAA